MQTKDTLTITEIEAAKKNGDNSLERWRMENLPDDVSEFGLSLENHGLHPSKPFEHNLEWWINKSNASKQVFERIIATRNNERANDERFLSYQSISDGFGLSTQEPSDAVLAILKKELSESYTWLLTDESKLSKTSAKELIEDVTNMDLFLKKQWTVRTKLNDSSYIVGCDCTLLENSYTSNRNLKFINRTRRIGQIVELILSSTLKNIPKANRPQLYNVSNGTRPDNKQYWLWNGMQVFDLDLKNSPDFDKIEDFDALKTQLFNALSHYHWLVGIGLSSSGRGIHIYTKCTKPHCISRSYDINEHNAQFWFQMSYLTKYAAIRYVLTHICGIRESTQIGQKVIDWSLAKLSHGIKVSYDPNFIINNNFEDLYPQFELGVPPVDGLEYSEWLFTDEIRNERTYQNWLNMYADWNNPNFVPESFSSENFILEDNSIQSVKPYDGEIKYQLRYHVCNTIADLFGDSGRPIAHTILRSDFCNNRAEIDNMFNCAISTKKTATKFGVQVLQKCGVKIRLKEEYKEKLDSSFEDDVKNLILKPANTEQKIASNWSKVLNSDEYLGMYSEEILEHVEPGKANLLISPPGVGKTEFIKALAKHKRVCLVLPYISVIDAKIVNDSGIKELFDVYQGSITTEKLVKGRSAVMTIDKFSNLDPEKVSYLFDYIAIDESHLLFTSGFRIEAMSNAVKNIKHFIQINSFDEYSAKMILMTGTPTGEQLYFNYYNCLNTLYVTKKENRTKEIQFILCKNDNDMIASIAVHIANAIRNGKRVLYPTNAGDVQAVKLIGMVEYELQRTIKWGYYKKANADSDMAVSINDSASIKDYELVLASNYLSVGIDINDIQDFECIYDDSFAAYEIEQFNCRLRKVDITSTVYIPLNDNDGNVRTNLLNFTDFSIQMNREDRNLVRDYMDISSKKMELSMSYDPITNKIYTPGFRVENGQIVFKLEEHELTLFEERFLECMRTPFFISKGMAEYGYTISIKTKEELEESSVNELIKVGLENARLESEIRNDKMVATTNWLFNNDTYKTSVGGTIDDLVNRIWKDGIKCIEDPDITEPQVNESYLGDIESIIVPSRRIFDDQVWVVQRILSVYSVETGKFIFNSCLSSNGRINKSEVNRYIKLISLIKAEERGTLGNELHLVIDDVYDYIHKLGINDEKTPVSNVDIDNKIDELTENYLSYLNLNLRTTKMLSKYRDEIAELFKTLIHKRKTKDGFVLEFRILPTPDGKYIKKIEEYHATILKIFEMSDTQLPDEVAHEIRMNHIDDTSKHSAEGLRGVYTKKSELDIDSEYDENKLF